MTLINITEKARFLVEAISPKPPSFHLLIYVLDKATKIVTRKTYFCDNALFSLFTCAGEKKHTKKTTKDKKKHLVDVFAFRCRWCWMLYQHRLISYKRSGISVKFVEHCKESKLYIKVCRIRHPCSGCIEKLAPSWYLSCYLRRTYFTTFSSVTIVNIEQVNAGWACLLNTASIQTSWKCFRTFYGSCSKLLQAYWIYTEIIYLILSPILQEVACIMP